MGHLRFLSRFSKLDWGHDLGDTDLFLANLVEFVQLGQSLPVDVRLGELAMEEAAPLCESLVGPLQQGLVPGEEGDVPLIQLVSAIWLVRYRLLLSICSTN